MIEEANEFHVDFLSSDVTTLAIDAKRSTEFNSNSIFKSMDEVSKFFEKGSIGYSPKGNDLEGLKLNTYSWNVKPLEVTQVRSSYFENEALFPKGSIQFDNAILMENIEHEWQSIKSISHSCL